MEKPEKGAYRMERDSMGEVAVPADREWGAQTQRSLLHFAIGTETMPPEILRAFLLLKEAAAEVNGSLGRLDSARAGAIGRTCRKLLGELKENPAGTAEAYFPLSVWQTGSGTQTNMNVNEVVARVAGRLLLEETGANPGIHPNDHVNRGQSSNDTFPSALHIAAVTLLEEKTLPALKELREAFARKERLYASLVKIGRTHLQDATPLTLGQEISGWRAMLEKTEKMIAGSMDGLRELAIGGTAVGTGLNTHPEFGKETARALSRLTGTAFTSSDNKFHALSSRDGLVFAHGALKALAADLMKIANDIRWLASGPRCGIGELILPENEPGSSIMPGKVNPTQCEAVTMAACQVMGNDAAVGMAASQGNFQLNVFLPVLALNFLQSARILGDVMDSFRRHCVEGMEADEEKIKENVKNSLMLVTALTPVLGYDEAAEIAKEAHRNKWSLKEAAVRSGRMTGEAFDAAVRPEAMTGRSGPAE